MILAATVYFHIDEKSSHIPDEERVLLFVAYKAAGHTGYSAYNSRPIRPWQKFAV
jgi:hypothetical protein